MTEPGASQCAVQQFSTLAIWVWQFYRVAVQAWLCSHLRSLVLFACLIPAPSSGAALQHPGTYYPVILVLHSSKSNMTGSSLVRSFYYFGHLAIMSRSTRGGDQTERPSESSVRLPLWEIGGSDLVGSNPGQVKPMTLKLIFVAS